MKNLNKWKWRYRYIIKNEYVYKCRYDKKYTLYSPNSIKYIELINTNYYYKYIPYYRHPKTLNELKQYDKKYTRPSRNQKRLVNSWDDIYVKIYKSWKNSTKRKHQWKNEKHSKMRQEMINEYNKK